MTAPRRRAYRVPVKRAYCAPRDDRSLPVLLGRLSSELGARRSAVLGELAAELGSPRDRLVYGWVLYAVTARGGGCELRSLQQPDAGWSRLPHRVIVEAIRQADCGPGAALVGVAVRFRGWDLPWHALSGPGLGQALDDFADGRARLRPDRVACEVILAAGPEGITWEARRAVGQAAARTFTYPPGCPLPRDIRGASALLRGVAAALPGSAALEA